MTDGWPVILAARSIRKSLLGRIKDTSQPGAASKRTPLSTEGVLLEQFFASLQDPQSRRLLNSWLDFRARAWDAQSAEGASDASSPQSTKESLLSLTAEGSTVPERRSLQDLTSSDFDELKRLFGMLLGVAILRPLNTKATPADYASCFYCAINHPMLDLATVKSIMNTVIIPPEKGSVGEAIKQGFVQSPASFGERRGVVEWQDLVLGQASMVNVRFVDEENECKCTMGVVSAFLPVLGVFSSIDDPKATTFADLLSKEVDRFRPEIICALCDAQSDEKTNALTQDFARNAQNESGNHNADQTNNLNQLIGKVAEALVPSSFQVRPNPLQAVAVVRPRSVVGKAVRLSCVRFEDTLVSGALSSAVLTPLAKSLSSLHSGLLLVDNAHAGLQKIDEMISAAADENGWRYKSTLLDVLPGLDGWRDMPAHRVLMFPRPLAPRELRNPATGDNSPKVPTNAWWFIHRDKGDGWPALERAYEDIDRAYRHLWTLVDELSPAHPDFPAKQKALDAAGFSKEWRQRNALYKLRQNVLASFFDLISRVLASPAEQRWMAEQQLRHILNVALHPPCSGFGPDVVARDGAASELAEEIIRAAQNIANTLRGEFLAMTSCSIVGGQVIVDEEPEFLLPEQAESVGNLIHIARMGGYRLEPVLPESEVSSTYPTSTSISCVEGSDADLFKRFHWKRIELQDNTCEGGSATLFRRAEEGGEIRIRYRFARTLNSATTLNASSKKSQSQLEIWEDGLTEKLKDLDTREKIKDALNAYLGVEFDYELPGRDSVASFLYALRPGETKMHLELKSVAPVAALLEHSIRISEMSASHRLESYARAASHSLKNALLVAEASYVRSPRRFLNLIRAETSIEELRERADDFGNQMLGAQKRVNALKEQSQIFFWMMDPNRAASELTEGNPVTLDVGKTLAQITVEAASLAIVRVHWAKWYQQTLQDPEGPLARQVSIALEEVSTKDDLSIAVARMKRVLQEFGTTFSIPEKPLELSVPWAIRTVFESVLAELLQNAFRATLAVAEAKKHDVPSGHNVPSVQVDLDWILAGGVLVVTITNTATEEDKRRFESKIAGRLEEGTDDSMSGNWQLELLKNRLGTFFNVTRQLEESGEVINRLIFQCRGE